MNQKINVLVVTNQEAKTIGICEALETDTRINEIFPAVSSIVNDKVAKDAFKKNAVIVFSGITENISEYNEESSSTVDISGGVDELFICAVQMYKKRKDLQRQAKSFKLTEAEAIGQIFRNMLLDQEGWVERIVNSLSYLPVAQKPVKLSELLYVLEEGVL